MDESPVLALAEVIVRDGAAWQEFTAQELPPLMAAMRQVPGFLKVSVFSEEGARHWLALSWWRDRDTLIEWHRTPAHKRIEAWAEANEARIGLWIGFTESLEGFVIGEGVGAPKT